MDSFGYLGQVRAKISISCQWLTVIQYSFYLAEYFKIYWKWRSNFIWEFLIGWWVINGTKWTNRILPHKSRGRMCTHEREAGWMSWVWRQRPWQWRQWRRAALWWLVPSFHHSREAARRPWWTPRRAWCRETWLLPRRNWPHATNRHTLTLLVAGVFDRHCRTPALLCWLMLTREPTHCCWGTCRCVINFVSHRHCLAPTITAFWRKISTAQHYKT